MRDIALCHPRMQKIAAQWITACKAEGINVAISETLRTAAEQDALYAKGRTKPGNIVTNAKGSSYPFHFNLSQISSKRRKNTRKPCRNQTIIVSLLMPN